MKKFLLFILLPLVFFGLNTEEVDATENKLNLDTIINDIYQKKDKIYDTWNEVRGSYTSIEQKNMLNTFESLNETLKIWKELKVRIELPKTSIHKYQTTIEQAIYNLKKTTQREVGVELLSNLKYNFITYKTEIEWAKVYLNMLRQRTNISINNLNLVVNDLDIIQTRCKLKIQTSTYSWEKQQYQEILTNKLIPLKNKIQNLSSQLYNEPTSIDTSLNSFDNYLSINFSQVESCIHNIESGESKERFSLSARIIEKSWLNLLNWLVSE